MHVAVGFFGPELCEVLRQLYRLHQERAEPGRQGTGYRKLFMKDHHKEVAQCCRTLLGVEPDNDFWDVYILAYPEGAYIPPHRDEATAFGKRHHRVNVLIQEAEGGVLKVDGKVVPLEEGDAIVFEPDVEEHEVSVVTKGTRLVWSVGCWK